LTVRSLDEWRRAEATALPTWAKPQLTKLVDQPQDGPDWLHEIKFDGFLLAGPLLQYKIWEIRTLSPPFEHYYLFTNLRASIHEISWG
jgi:hypothetical protein